MPLWHQGPKIDHLLFECELLNKERDRLILTVSKTDV